MIPPLPIQLSRLDWRQILHYCTHPEEIDTRSPTDEEIIALQSADLRTLTDFPPLPAYCDLAYPVSPPPLHLFDHPQHHARLRNLYDSQHLTLRSLLGRHFAGHPNPPTARQVRQLLLARAISASDQPILYQIFASITPAELRALHYHEALTIWELARAVHRSTTRRRDLCRILQQFLPAA